MRFSTYVLVTAVAFSSFTPVAFCDENECAKNSGKFTGMADYYHHKLYGQKTASGEVLKKDRLTAAHRTLPFGTKVKVTCKKNGRSCVVVINDRGPFTKNKVIDLSHEAAKQLGVLEMGTGLVGCVVMEDE